MVCRVASFGFWDLWPQSKNSEFWVLGFFTMFGKKSGLFREKFGMDTNKFL
jgi:hypothetical protein